MTRIVVGLDGSSGSLTALHWAVEQATVLHAEVDAVLAYNYDLAWIDIGSDYETKWIEGHAHAARDALQQILADALPEPLPIAVHPVVVEGAPAAVLVEMSRNASLLVVGTRGRGGFTGLLLGSVSQRCAEHAHCPVVIVPTVDDTSALPGANR